MWPDKKVCKERFEDKIMPIIFEHEGGYSDEKSDKGGKTNRGISWGTWKNFAKKDIGVEAKKVKIKEITMTENKPYLSIKLNFGMLINYAR